MPPKGPQGGELQLPFLDRFARIDTLSRIEGFIPASGEELKEVMMLNSCPPEHGGAAQHLAEVIKHQIEAETNDPRRAARKIVRNYINYAQNAQKSTHNLNSLQSTLSEVFNPELIVDRVVEPSEPGLLEFLRYFDLQTVRITGSTAEVGYDPMKVKYLPDNGGIMYYLGLAIETWRVHQLRKELPFAVEEQSARRDYFVARLGEVVQHFPVLRPIAREGLEKLAEAS